MLLAGIRPVQYGESCQGYRIEGRKGVVLADDQEVLLRKVLKISRERNGNRGARTSLEYAILTNEIMQGAFALKVDEYKQVKGLERENLRDHMTDIELILTMLAEEQQPQNCTVIEIHRVSNRSRKMPGKAAA